MIFILRFALIYYSNDKCRLSLGQLFWAAVISFATMNPSNLGIWMSVKTRSYDLEQQFKLRRRVKSLTASSPVMQTVHLKS